jgi:hypothetical protein
MINFVKSQLRTFAFVELFENFPKKTYNEENLTLDEAKFSKNQFLMVKLIN